MPRSGKISITIRTFAATMKQKLGFFFFLLIFIQCSNDDKRSLSFLPDVGQIKTMPGNRSLTNKQPHFTGALNSSETKTSSTYHRKKRIKQLKNNDSVKVAEISRENNDSIFISRLNFLISNRLELDLNEPVSKNFLFSAIGTLKSPSLITVSNESFLTVNFDNDILDYTDRFYTNGIKIDLIAPGLRMNPLGWAMIPYWGSGKNYYGITVVQNMYTPSTTKIGGILYGDRPYSAYLYLGSFKITLDPDHTFRQTSELDIGIIGPKSYGEWVQSSFHKSIPTNNEPLGWEYQIRNDLVLNYSIKMEKGIWSRKNVDVLLSSCGEVGTLYTNLSGGFQFRAGWLNPFFSNMGVAKKVALKEKGLRKFQFIFFIKGSGKIVGYDATLEGGLFNRSSAYTLPAREISRVLLQSSSGISVSYNGFRIDLEQFVLSPDFHNGWWHKWVHLSLAFCL